MLTLIKSFLACKGLSGMQCPAVLLVWCWGLSSMMMETFVKYVKPGLKNLNLISLCWRQSEWPRQRMGTRCGPAKWQTKLAASISLSGTIRPTWSSLATLSSSLKVIRCSKVVCHCALAMGVIFRRLENSVWFILRFLNSVSQTQNTVPSRHPTRWFRTAVLRLPGLPATSPASKSQNALDWAPHQVLVVACTPSHFLWLHSPSTWIIWSQPNHSYCPPGPSSNHVSKGKKKKKTNKQKKQPRGAAKESKRPFSSLPPAITQVFAREHSFLLGCRLCGARRYRSH